MLGEVLHAWRLRKSMLTTTDGLYCTAPHGIEKRMYRYMRVLVYYSSLAQFLRRARRAPGRGGTNCSHGCPPFTGTPALIPIMYSSYCLTKSFCASPAGLGGAYAAAGGGTGCGLYITYGIGPGPIGCCGGRASALSFSSCSRSTSMPFAAAVSRTLAAAACRAASTSASWRAAVFSQSGQSLPAGSGPFGFA